MSENNGLPDFLCVGPGRTGTTWLHAVLKNHVALPRRVKETRFWGQMFHKGLDWYSQNFSPTDPSQLVAEICPYFPEAAARRRIAEHIPGCKIIILLRDPVERSYSQFRRFRSRGIMHYGFEEALQKHPRITQCNRYAYHLKGWLDLFGAKNVLVLLFDELRASPQGFLNRICRFVGIPDIDLQTAHLTARDINSDKRFPRSETLAKRASRLMEWFHRNSWYRGVQAMESALLYDLFFSGGAPFPALDPEIAQRARKQLRPEIEAAESMLAIDLSAWKEPHQEFVPVASKAEKARAIGALLLALVPLTTGAVPDGLDVSSMKFDSQMIVSAYEDDSEDDTHLWLQPAT